MNRSNRRSSTVTDDDNGGSSKGATLPSIETTQLRSNRTPRKQTGKASAHQEDDNWKTIEKPSLGQVFGSAKTTRYKFRLHVHLTIKPHEHEDFINVPKLQKDFCIELFRADKSTNILKWHEEQNKSDAKANPITTVNQLPTDRKNLSEWIAGTTAQHNRNNTQTLKFFMYLETSTSYSFMKQTMKPWLDVHKHRIFATNLSSTNNRLLAWVKDSHPDWTRLDDFRKKLQDVVIKHSECDSCELDLRPRRTRIGQGSNAIFIWAIGITCSLSKVNCYMRALLTGLSKSSNVPPNLKHVQIIPFNPIQGLIDNKKLTALAYSHDHNMDTLRKKSVIGFADITTQQIPKDESSPISFQDFLLSQTNDDDEPLFHSVESRGKNGYLVIYQDHQHDNVETFFKSDIHDEMTETFQDEFTIEYFKKVNQSQEIDLTEENSAISGFSTAESYYQDITSTISEIQIDADNNTNATKTTATKNGKFAPKNRTNKSLVYSDELSSLGSKSAQRQNMHNAWNSPLQLKTPSRKKAPVNDDDASSIATLRTDVQSWFDQLKEESQREWDKKFSTIDYLKEKLNEVSKSNERLHVEIKSIQEENRAMIQDLIQNNLKQLIDQSVSNHVRFQQQDTPVSSPHRKQQKTSMSGTMSQPTTQTSIADFIKGQQSSSDQHSINSTDSPQSMGSQL